MKSIYTCQCKFTTINAVYVGNMGILLKQISICNIFCSSILWEANITLSIVFVPAVLDMARHVPLYRALLELLRAISTSTALVPLLLPLSGNPGQDEDEEDEEHSEGQTSVGMLLAKMKTCVDTYTNRLRWGGQNPHNLIVVNATWVFSFFLLWLTAIYSDTPPHTKGYLIIWAGTYLCLNEYFDPATPEKHSAGRKPWSSPSADETAEHYCKCPLHTADYVQIG